MFFYGLPMSPLSRRPLLPGAHQRSRAPSFSSSRWDGPRRARKFLRISRSSRSARFSRRSRRTSSCSTVVSPSWRRPASRSACRTQFRIAWAEGSNWRPERGSPVAVETIGNWYWIVDEIEAAGCVPKLVHARKAKLMMGEINKTDKLDARGLNRLQRNATLPTVWIPPGELRDQRDLPRTRMVLVRQRTQLKNRIHATVAKYALHDLEASDFSGVRGRALLRQRFDLLPPHTAYASQQLLEQVEELDRRVREFEQRIQAVFKPTPAIQLLLTLPGVGLTLAAVFALAVGDVARFARAEKLAADAGG